MRHLRRAQILIARLGRILFWGAIALWLSVRVAASRRIVDLFKVAIRCATGGGGGFQAGPPAEEFISAAGMFRGAGNAEWRVVSNRVGP